MKQIQMIANAPKRFLSQNIRSTVKRILERLGTRTSSSLVKISYRSAFLISKPISYFFGSYMALFFYLETNGVY